MTLTTTTLPAFHRSEYFDGTRGACTAGCRTRCFMSKATARLSDCPNYRANPDFREAEPEPEQLPEQPQVAETEGDLLDTDLEIPPVPQSLSNHTLANTRPRVGVEHAAAHLQYHHQDLAQALDRNTARLERASKELQDAAGEAEALHAKLESCAAALTVLGASPLA